SPAHWRALREIAWKHGLALVEDSAESIGSLYRGERSGGLADAGIFAFYPNKQITTGEGGAVLTDDDEIASMARSLRNQGRGTDGGWLAHQMLGYNFRISDINCALGRAQLSRLDEIVASRASVAETYNRLLEDVAEIQTPYVASEIKMSWFVYVVQLIPEFNQEDRDQILEYLRDRGIGCSNYFPCIHLEPFYRTNFEYGPGEFPIAEGVSDRSIALPFYGKLELNDAERVVETLQQAIAHVRTSHQA
ncbi:MAG: DegT/DnrJ/EryC1/StrS family aminotransferase, partial [Chloroflexi bacterium]|nr:DegT/DnrJ/EryC1/StrS family aminotransferase [Chloroflexota bacterium]